MLRWAAAIGCVCSGGFVSPVGAVSLTFDQVILLGELNADGSGKKREENYINQLAGMTPHTEFNIGHQTYTRSGNRFDSLPTANFEFRVNHDHTGIVLDGTYDYLLARYGSAATVVWYVSGLTGSYDLPADYGGERDLSHYSLFRGVSTKRPQPPKGVKVPDSGSTWALIGLSLVSLGLVQRKVGKSRPSPRK